MDIAANNLFDYNIYYFNANTSKNFAIGSEGQKTFTQWKALSTSPDVHSTFLTSIPGFVNRYTDLHPADCGNLNGLGITLAEYKIDKDRNPRSDPPTPGCYEVRSSRYPQVMCPE